MQLNKTEIKQFSEIFFKASLKQEACVKLQYIKWIEEVKTGSLSTLNLIEWITRHKTFIKPNYSFESELVVVY